ncbi:MAG: winged helix-turn-helix transcriptional regulator, partial [Candidatus Peribacteraceae bacterium]|nr:winged helix-turn-helix transcriptional regulator [Candidatus Peribacteraceae bacterium]
IELNLTASMVCSNFNRLCIFYLLKKTNENEMQVEKIASNLGISHRTALYHLDILQSYKLVEVREFRKKGQKLLRSVWGLSTENSENLVKIFNRITQKVDINNIEEMITVNDGKKSPRCCC